MIQRMKNWFTATLIFGLALVAFNAARACPFCGGVQLTLAQEMKAADAAVVAELVETPARPAGAEGAFPAGLSDPLVKSKFKILEVLKGPAALKKAQQIETIYFGELPVGSQFLVTAVDPTNLAWATPIPLTKRSREYVDALLKLPDSGPARLAFFEPYLEDQDEIIKRDAYDEFGQAPYPDVQAFGPHINYPQLIKWLNTPDIAPSHRRLYFTLLGVCGTQKDLPLFESLFESKDRKLKGGLDAMIGAYLAIKGPTGLSLIEKLFLQDQEAEFTDTYAAIQAIRIAQETGILTKGKSAEAFHYMLDRPKMADLVIPDLARWQDWSVADRLVDLFVTADADSAWVRVPVLRYLQICPTPEAKKQLTRLEMLDPTAAKQAQSVFLPGGAAMAPAPPEKPATANSTAPAKSASTTVLGK